MAKINTTPGNIIEDKETWESEEIEAVSNTKLEDDDGTGNKYILRMFQFGINPEAFKNNPPTPQQIFNSHLKGIEAMLWADGLEIFYEVEPRLVFSKRKTHYQIFVTAKANKSNLILQDSSTLKELTHGKSRGNKN